MRRWPALVVAALALLLGYAAWKAWLGHVRPDYRPLLAWTEPWIAHGEPGVAHGYFRRTLALTERPARAWVAVMAPDEFVLFVNGRRAETAAFHGAYAQRVVDITPHLEVGRNVVAVHNVVSTFRQRPRIVVQGAVVSDAGVVTAVQSDASWRATARDESLGAQGGLARPVLWTRPEYDDARWSSALVLGPSPESRIEPLTLPPVLVTAVPRGPWMWIDDPTAAAVFLRAVLVLDEMPRELWLRLIARRHHRLLVNGYTVSIAEQAVGTTSTGPDRLLLVNVTPYLRRGRNVVALHVASEHADRGVSVEALALGRGLEPSWLAPLAWKGAARPAPGWEQAAFDDAGWAPAAWLRPLSPAEQARLVTARAATRPPLEFVARRALGLVLVDAAALVACAAVWVLTARLLARATGASWAAARAWAALAALPPTLALALTHVLRYDPRLPTTLPFEGPVVLGAVALWVALLVALLAAASGFPARGPGDGPPPGPLPRLARLRRALAPLAAAGLGLLAFALRVRDVAYEPLIGDEASGLGWTLGVLARGYPSMLVEGAPRPVFTSELVYYVKAIGVAFLGADAQGLRVPDVVMGSLTTLALYGLGTDLAGRRTGLIAAALYAVLPSAIGMTHYGRYPSQLQLCAVLTLWALRRAFAGPAVRPGWYYAATAAFAATFLSWEGSAFYGPALALGVLVFRRPRFDWLRSRHVWAGVGLVAALVVGELCARYLSQVAWPGYRIGAADVAPALMWRYPFFDPWYYARNFFLLEQHQALTALVLVGLPLWARRSAAGRALGLVGVCLVAHLAMMTLFLYPRNWRYVYLVLPLLVLAASITLSALLDAVDRAIQTPVPPGAVTALRRLGVLLVLAAVLVCSSTLVVRFHGAPLAFTTQYTRQEARYNPAMATAAAYVREHWRPGDVVVSAVPHVTQHYLGSVDYFADTLASIPQPMLLGDQPELPIHRYAGVPAILSEAALDEVRARSGRVWVLVLDPRGDLGHIDPIRGGGRLVFQDWRAGVVLLGSPL